MSEAPRPPEKREIPATPGQAQDVLDQIDRITENVQARPGLEGVRNNSAPRKISWSENVRFIRFPDGEGNPDDSDSIRMGQVAWKESDGTLTALDVNLTLDGMRLVKHIKPPRARRSLLVFPKALNPETQSDRAEQDHTPLSVSRGTLLGTGLGHLSVNAYKPYIRREISDEDLTASSGQALTEAEEAHKARLLERSLGLDIVASNEAETRITQLKNMPPIPEQDSHTG